MEFTAEKIEQARGHIVQTGAAQAFSGSVAGWKRC